MNSAVSFIIGFLGIALMVTVHETGHFVVARRCGISVEEFAIGWGKAIKRWRKGGVDYRINIFPLGGYCRLKGSDDLAHSLDDDGKQFKNPEEGSVFSVHPLKRIATYLAGPLANVLFAILIFILFFLMGYETYADPNRIVVTSDYPKVFGLAEGETAAASRAGLRTGDTIISVDGMTTEDFPTLQKVLASRSIDREAHFLVRRDGRELSVMIRPDMDKSGSRVLFGVSSFIEPIIASIRETSMEHMTSLAPGDTILSINGKPVAHTIDLVEAVSDNPALILMEVRQSDGMIKTVSYMPDRLEDGSVALGFSIARNTKQVSGFSFGSAVAQAFSAAFGGIADTVTLLPSLFTGAFSLDEVLAGPLRISYVMGEARNAGLRSVLQLFAMVSLSLAVANLLPIPALDGGLVLLSLFELIRGKSISPHMYVRFQSIGITFLLLLMIFVIVGDLRFFLHV